MRLTELLARIRQRPVIYLQEKRSTLLEHFINGVLFAQHDQGPSCYVDAKAMADFRDWLHKKPNIKPSFWLSDELIQMFGTDEKAFIEFFNLFDDFVRTHDVGILAPGDIEIKLPTTNFKGEPRVP
jgi:hypothetical protein